MVGRVQEKTSLWAVLLWTPTSKVAVVLAWLDRVPSQCGKGTPLHTGFQEAGGGAGLKLMSCFGHCGWSLAAETCMCTRTDPDFQPLGPG